MVGEDHEDDVEDPDDVPAEDQADEGADPMTFFEAGDEAQDPRGDRDDAEDQRNDPT